MNRIFTLLVGLFMSLQLSAQSNLKVDYDNDSRWFWTFNLGSTWTTADVTKKNDWGYGFTLGKSFNYNYGRPISFDIRARYLTGAWYGQDGDTTGFQYGNAALSSADHDYKTDLGFAVLNHQTKLHELSLELVLHANNLRANSGWDPYIFGGIGYTWFRAKGDLVDAFDSTYAYDGLGANFSASDAANLRDDSYESYLDGSSDVWTATWMPSLGFGLGYQAGKRFSLGLEHKTTFTMDDIFDGSVNPTGKRENDWYHYTSFYLRFHIKDHRVVVDDNTNTLENVNNYDQTQTNQNIPPVVTFTNPATSGTVVSVANYVIKANVQNVVSSSNVVFRQNGQYNTNFTFNPSTQQFESIVTLQPGQNIFELTGTNTVGSDQEQTIIIYNREQNNPPVVTYSNPAGSPTTVQNPSFNVVATILNVDNSSQVVMTVNGASVGATFNASTHVANATINLQVGTNIVTTTGTNAYGTDSESTTIIYNPAQTEQPPVVYFVDPSYSPYTTNNNTFVINADVLNVSGAQNILFKQNGVVNQNFNYNAQSDDFQSTVVLNPGQNVFEIIGSNSAGSASATTIIIFDRPAPKPPIVTITNPSNNPYETANATFNMTSTVLNVTQASQITVKLNGQNIAFNYNASNNGVYATLNLVTGSNVVTVSATNADGSDSKQTTIIYRPTQVVQPPVVQVTIPNADPFTVSQPTYTLMASVLNVPNVSGVNVNVNGTNVTNFTFANNSVTLALNLIEGANVITITGTNTAGTASDQQTIIYRKPVVAQPPLVSFVDPAVSPTTVYAPTYAVKARVRFVSNASQIALNINGTATTNFVYSASSEIMDFTTVLVPGANVITITATNPDGQATASTTIIYRRPETTNPPVVTITNPALNPSVVTTITTPVAATVLNVQSQANISVTLNGAAVTNFTYDSNTKQVNFTANLVVGNNTVTVTGTNTAGSASDSKVITFRRQETINPPLVTFVNPAVSGTTVGLANYVVRVKIENVNTANQIVFLQDGQVVNPSLWVFDAGTKELTFNAALNAGNNVFTATGTNAAGTHTATTTIIYRKPVVVCDKPVITMTNPSVSGTTVVLPEFAFTATITNLTNANQVKVLVNGSLQSSGSYIPATGMYSRMITLSEGQNSIEVQATNACGETKAITTIIYKKPAAPCLEPSVQLIQPQPLLMQVVETVSVSMKAAVSNVANASEITVQVNGVNVAANYDAGTHLLTAELALNVGINTVQIVATNSCGTDKVDFKVERKECVKPSIQITKASANDGSTVVASDFELQASVIGVTSASDITITQNGIAVGFTFDANTGVLLLKRDLNVGNNGFVITVRNNCGTQVIKYTVIRKQAVVINPPTVNIMNPASNIIVTSDGMTVQIAVANVTAQNQIAVTLNGSPVNFTFDSNTGSVSFNATYNNGSNLISCTVVNSAGSATDSRTVTYNKVDAVPPPTIQLKKIANCPVLLPRGPNSISATITNVTMASQVSVMLNGAPVAFTSQVSGFVMTITIQITVSGTANIPLVITATNDAGTEVKTCEIGMQIPSGGTETTEPTEPSGTPRPQNGGGTITEPVRGSGTIPTTTPIRKPE
jgi:hypothetical protein